jgi:hypothetical protein
VKQSSKFNFFSIVKWFFIAIFIFIHIQFLRGLAEALPAMIPSLSHKIEAVISDKYHKHTRRSTYTKGTNSSSYTSSSYLEVQFTIEEKSYTNKDLVDDIIYDAVEKGDSLEFSSLKGFPSIGHISQNANFITNNFIFLSSVLFGVDLIIFIIFKYIKRWRRKMKTSRK